MPGRGHRADPPSIGTCMLASTSFGDEGGRATHPSSLATSSRLYVLHRPDDKSLNLRLWPMPAAGHLRGDVHLSSVRSADSLI